jgi:hypothetical protein
MRAAGQKDLQSAGPARQRLRIRLTDEQAFVKLNVMI